MSSKPSDILFIQPPMILPTSIMAGVPHLVANLRRHGYESTILDLGIDLLNATMTSAGTADLLKRAKKRTAELNGKNQLNAVEALEYGLLAQHSSLENLPHKIENAISVFKDERMYDHHEYYSAARCATEAMGLLSAVSFPLALDFGSMYSHTHDINNSSSELWAGIEQFSRNKDSHIHQKLSQIMEREIQNTPKLIGISICYSQQLFFGLWIADQLRKKFPESFILLGGPTVGKLARKCHLRNQWPLFRAADAIAVGDGEELIVDIAKQVLEGEKVGPRENVILYDKESKTGNMPGISYLKDLDSVPPADYRGIDFGKYWIHEPTLPLCVGRGCYWDKCTFCHFGDVIDPRRVTSAYREMSIQNIVDQMILQNERHGCRHFSFVTDAASPAFLLKLSKALIARGREDFRWSVQARAEKNFKKERIETMKQGGCVYIFFGLESFDDDVLAAIDKGTTADQYARVLGAFYEAGIATGAMGFFDFPTEDYQAAQKSLQFLSDHKDSISEINWGYFALEQGARAYKNPSQYGIAEIFEDEQDDLTQMVSYRLEQEMKTPEQNRELADRLYELAQAYNADFSRPFLAGSRCEHSTFYYDRFGPGALKQFSSSIKTLTQTIAKDVTIRLETAPFRSRYPLTRLLDLRRSITESLERPGQLIDGQYQQTKLVGLKKRGSGAFHSAYREWTHKHGHVEIEEAAGEYLASPWGCALITDELLDIFRFFENPATISDLENELDQEADELLPIMIKALNSGWLSRSQEA